jgi:uncharacterized protein (DUF433 family)
MITAARVYTPAEAAAVSNVGLKAVHNAIDKRIVETVARPASRSGGSAGRALTGEGLIRLKLWYGVGGVLPADRRQRLFDAIKAEPTAEMVRADDFLIVDVAEARKQVAARVRELDDATSVIHSVKGVLGGEPVFKGTRIPVRLVAAMLADGADEAEILEGYPKLSSRMLDLARLWVAAHPRRGRPKSVSEQGYKLKSVRRTALKGDSQGSLKKAGEPA